MRLEEEHVNELTVKSGIKLGLPQNKCRLDIVKWFNHFSHDDFILYFAGTFTIYGASLIFCFITPEVYLWYCPL